jgi:hypothetical protein
VPISISSTLSYPLNFVNAGDGNRSLSFFISILTICVLFLGKWLDEIIEKASLF